MTGSPEDRLGKAALVIRRLKEKIGRLEEGARREPVAIVGAGCRFPGGADGLDAYWSLLTEGRDGIRELAGRWALVGESPRDGVPSWAGLLEAPIDAFDAEFFGISPREAAALDPQHRLLLEVGWEALEHAGIPASSLGGSRSGVFVGACVSDYGNLVAARLGDAQDAYAVTGNLLSVAAGRLAYTWGLEGPCITVDTACSSSLVAVHLAARSVAAGECELALAGGVNVLLSPLMMGALGKTQALAPDGRCKTFDALADGFARGEGCGLVVLKRLRDAERDGDRVLAVLRGSAINQDGRSTGLTAPNVRAQEALLRAALADAGVEAGDVGFVETHGTGTSLGDPIEVEALRAVLGDARREQPCVLGAVKTNLGHLEAAAGIAGLIKAVLVLDRQAIPSNLNLRTLNPRIRLGDGLTVAASPHPWPRARRPRCAGVSSFGMSGTNAHVILGEAPPRPAKEAVPARAVELLVLSAKSDAALSALAERLRAQLEGGSAPRLHDLAASLATTRSALPHRLGFAAASVEEAAAALAEAGAGEVPSRGDRGRIAARGKVAFVFPGQGGQWVGMGRGLLASEPAFAQAIGACSEAIEAEAGWSLLDALRGDGPAPQLDRIDRIQPALFAISVALAALWRVWGIEPDVVVGHSMGEVAAACVAGALSITDAVAVICRRSRRLLGIRGRGAMALVELPWAAAAAAIEPRADRLSVAVSNSRRSTVISGEPEALDELLDELAREGVFARRVKVDVASHSPQVDPLAPGVLEDLATLRPRRAAVPMRSTVLSATLTGDELDAAYWVANLREPVRFAQAVESLLAAGCRHFIELGPHPVLTPAIAELQLDASVAGVAVGSLRREAPERGALLESLAALWVAGVAPSWSALFSGGERVPLPTYPWQRERHWIAAGPRLRPEPGGKHPLLGELQSVATLPGVFLWERSIDRARLPWIDEHRLRDVAVFPGAGYLEMIFAAAAERIGEAPLRVENAAFVEAMVLVDDTPIRTQVVAEELRAGENQLRIASQAAGSEWIIHASATIRPDTGARPPDVDIAALREHLGAPASVVELYAELAAAGFAYGPAFRGLVELRCADGEALGRVELPAAAGASRGYRFHPALLDACLQVMVGGIRDEDTWMPIGVDTLRLLARPNGPLWCHARLRTVEADADLRTADFTVVDAAGAVVLELCGLRARRVASRPEGSTDGWFLKTSWERRAAPARRVTGGRWLLIAAREPEGSELLRGLARALEGAGQSVAYAPAQAGAEALRQRIDGAFGGLAPTALVHLQGERRGAPLEGAASDLLATTQAALTATTAPLRLWSVTRGAQAIEGEPVALAQAPVIGLVRTIALEHPELACTSVDLGVEPREDDLHGLVAELLGDAAEQEIALRGGLRWVARVVRAPPHRLVPGDMEPTIRGDRSYLVTGGLGGLGSSVARWLAERGAGHLVLVSRSGAQRPAQRELVAAIEATGAEVTVARADASDRRALAEVIDRIASSGRPLAGVVHTAGVLDDALISAQSPSRLRTALAAKAAGAIHLHDLTATLPLDLFVLYGSAAGLLGAPGQGNYAAANALLDALAHHRRASGLPGLSVGWGLFADVGLAAAQENRGARLRTRGARSLTVDESLELLERLLASATAHTAVIPLDLNGWAELVPAVADMARFSRLRSATAGPREDGELAAEIADAPEGARRELTLRLLRRHVARVLRLDEARVDADAPLIALGLDSLMGLELKHRVRRDAGVDVPMTQLLRDMTVTRLAALVLDGAAEAEEPLPADPAAGWTDIEL